MTIVYDKQTHPLISHLHRVSGCTRTGKSTRVRNMITNLQREGNDSALDLKLTDAVNEIAGIAGRLEIGVPECHEFEIEGRELTCVHGLVERKFKFAIEYEYRFVVVFRDEVFTTLRAEFGMTDRKWAKLIGGRLAV